MALDAIRDAGGMLTDVGVGPTGLVDDSGTGLVGQGAAGRAWLWIAMIPGLLCLFFFGYGQRDRFLEGGNDFVQLYAGATLSGTPQLYEPDASREIHRRVLGKELDGVYYSRPPFYAFLLRPLAKLPYLTAYWLYQALSLCAVLGMLWIWLPGSRNALLAVAFAIPLLDNFWAGQDVAFTLLAFSLAVVAMRRKWDWLAGVLFSLCAIKFHLFLLVPVVLLVRGKWRVLGGGALGGIFLMALSFFSDGWDWPSRYRALLADPGIHLGVDHMPTLRGLIYGLTSQESMILMIVGGSAVLCMMALIARRADLESALGLALVGGLLVGYHAYLQDCLVLLVAFFLIAQRAKWPTSWGLCMLLLAPFLFLGLAFGRPWNVAIPVVLLGVMLWAAMRPMLADRSALGISSRRFHAIQ